MTETIKITKSGKQYEFSVEEYNEELEKLINLGMKKKKADIAVLFDLCDKHDGLPSLGEIVNA